MKRPFGVVFSAVLLLLLSLFQLLIGGMMAFSGALMRKQIASGGLHGMPAGAPMPTWMPIYMYALCAFFIALAVWGILTAVGLFRLRRWARYSVLVIGGALALIGLVSALTTLLFLVVPLPVASGMDASQVNNVQAITRVIFGVVGCLYLILCAVGVSWLVYFNRKKVCEVFAGGMGEAPQSRRPFLIAVIAILNLFGAATCLLMVFLPIPGAIFGLLLHGWQKAALYLAFAALELAVGVGLWRMAEWGRRLTLGMMVLMLAQSVVYLVRPSLLLQYSAELTQTMTPTQPPLPAHFQTVLYSASFGFSCLYCLAIAAVLIHYRAAFVRPIEPPRNEAAVLQ